MNIFEQGQDLAKEIGGTSDPRVMRDLLAVRDSLNAVADNKICKNYSMGTQRLKRLLDCFEQKGVQGLIEYPRRLGAIPGYRLPLINLDNPEIRSILKKVIDGDSEGNRGIPKESARVVLEAAERSGFREVARHLKLDHRKVREVLKRYHSQGIDGLRKRRSGPPKGAAAVTRGKALAERQRMSTSRPGLRVTDAEVAASLSCSESYVQTLLAQLVSKDRRQFISLDRCHAVAKEVRRSVVQVDEFPIKTFTRVTLKCDICESLAVIKVSSLIHDKGRCKCIARIRKKAGLKIYKTEVDVVDFVEKLTGWTFLRNVRPRFIYKQTGKHLEFDALNFEHRVAVEVQGEQHFRPIRFGGTCPEKSLLAHHQTVEHDRLKVKVCLNAGYTLITIGPVSHRRQGELRQACMQALITAGIPIRNQT